MASRGRNTLARTLMVPMVQMDGRRDAPRSPEVSIQPRACLSRVVQDHDDTHEVSRLQDSLFDYVGKSARSAVTRDNNNDRRQSE